MNLADAEHALHFRSDDGQFRLSVPEGAVQQLLKFCCEAGNVETGGILIGHYSADRTTAVVDRISGPPPDSKHFLSRFFRGVDGLQDLLIRMWSAAKRQYYLGEWHYHPLPDAEPSRDDIVQMNKIASSDRYACPEPVLLIAAGAPSVAGLFSATVHSRARSMQTMSRVLDEKERGKTIVR